MKLLANENVPLASVNYLVTLGVDILWIGHNHSGISDKDVMDIAISESRLIITFDRDYSELIFKFGYKPKSGVIYLRFEEYSPVFPGQLVYKVITNEELDLESKLTVIDEKGIRQRKY